MSLTEALPETGSRDDTDVAIRVRDLKKTFTVHSWSTTTLKEMVLRGMSGPAEKTTFNALEDIRFTLKRGRSLAVVGSNGSGKSTLLKMITGISHPTSGTIDIRGRVAALIELGAGFHPDLTGMENIFLQGSILGLSRKEILERLDTILEFSQLGLFIHTPLKKYSSGMRVRLGFSLAAHSEADILLIDEVLAVGDAAFQQRCFRRIGELRDRGCTILFVSHSIDHVSLIAEDMLWLEKGKAIAQGPAEEVLPKYSAALHGEGVLESNRSEGARENRRAHFLFSLSPTGTRVSHKEARIAGVHLLSKEDASLNGLREGDPLTLEIGIEVFERIERLNVGIGFGGFSDLRMGFSSQALSNKEMRNLEPGKYVVKAGIDHLPFRPGRYKVSVALEDSLDPDVLYDAHVEAYTWAS